MDRSDELLKELEENGRLERLAETIRQDPRSSIRPDQTLPDSRSVDSDSGFGTEGGTARMPHLGAASTWPPDQASHFEGALPPVVIRDSRAVQLADTTPGTLRSPAKLSTSMTLSQGAVSPQSTIGQGGTARVQLGMQHSLGRRVAVKSLKPEHRSETATDNLLREARVTGFLEHPNVVPVHDIALDDDGEPLIVLKYIEGQPWTDLLAAPDQVESLHGASDPTAFHIRVLLQVCRAVEFAHDHGILHRDIKPDNVMVGRFGEVHLLDWGLAAALDDRAPEGLPRAALEKRVLGTPSYMAPEMVVLGPERLNERTDIYLLGGLLTEIVTGHAPHRGADAKLIVTSILESPPLLPDEVPDELARIVRRAMARYTEDRYPTVRSFAEALEAYLEHRGLAELTEHSRVRLAQLEEAIEDALLGDTASEHEAHEHYIECRFGFQQALRDWPQNEVARRGLEQTVRAMVEYHLAKRDPSAAANALAELERPPAHLRAMVEAAVSKQEQSRAEGERLLEEQNPVAGRRMRIIVGVTVAAAWTLLPAIQALIGRRPESPLDLIVPTLSVWSVVFGVMLFVQRNVKPSALNRRFTSMFHLSQATELVLWTGANAIGLSGVAAVTVMHLAAGTICATIGITMARNFFVPAVAYAGAFILGAYVPEAQMFGQVAANLTLGAAFVFTWGRQQSDPVAPDGLPIGDA